MRVRRRASARPALRSRSDRAPVLRALREHPGRLPDTCVSLYLSLSLDTCLSLSLGIRLSNRPCEPSAPVAARWELAADSFQRPRPRAPAADPRQRERFTRVRALFLSRVGISYVRRASRVRPRAFPAPFRTEWIFFWCVLPSATHKRQVIRFALSQRAWPTTKCSAAVRGGSDGTPDWGA